MEANRRVGVSSENASLRLKGVLIVTRVLDEYSELTIGDVSSSIIVFVGG
ncbi:MAG: hypothetical protein IMY88_03530 [Chloroflexi bacterium]|nr:hypothetical protein [Chloroflexota bacterium]